MPPKRISILGITVDQSNAVEIVEKTNNFINEYKKLQPVESFHTTETPYSNFLTAINEDCIANIYSWGWNTVRNPELLSIFRNSKIITVESSAIVWLSWCLGNSLKEKVSGDYLIPLLAEGLKENNRSLFILGDNEEIAEKAKNYLKKINPGLNILGTLAPKVFTKGDRISEARQRDALILEEIHKNAPDVLLVCLGHPKQEIWLGRVISKLQVPVTICSGDTLECITDHVKPALRGLKALTLKEAARAFFGAKKSFYRNSYNMAHFLLLSTPLVICHRLNQLFVNLTRRNDSKNVKSSLLFLSENKSIAVLRVPEVLDGSNIKTLNHNFDEAFAQDAIIFDFKKTRSIDLEGIALLSGAWNRSKVENRYIFGFGMSWTLRFLMRLHKVWDIFSNDACSNPSEVAHRLFHNGMSSTLYESYHQNKNTLTISFFGSLDNKQDFNRYIQKLLPMIFQKDCVIDFTYCTLIDNMGFYFLLKLKQIIEGREKKLKIQGLSKTINNQFVIAGLKESFEINIPK